jgi:hypothetical protein
VLKGIKHPTFFKTYITERNRGNRFLQSGGRVFSVNEKDIKSFKKKNKDAEDITDSLNKQVNFMEPFASQSFLMRKPDINTFSPSGVPFRSLSRFQ